MQVLLWLLLAMYIIRVGSYLVWLRFATEKTIRKSSMYEKVAKSNKQQALFIGDSLALGAGASSPEKTIAGLFSADNSQYNIYNLSYNKLTTYDLLRQISKLLGNYTNVGIAVLSIGANDIIRFKPMIGLKKRMTLIVKEISKKSGDTYIFTPTKPGKSPLVIKLFVYYRVKNLRRIVQSLADSNVHHVDMWEAGDITLEKPEKYFTPDTVHLSDAGQKFWYQQFKAVF